MSHDRSPYINSRHMFGLFLLKGNTHSTTIPLPLSYLVSMLKFGTTQIFS